MKDKLKLFNLFYRSPSLDRYTSACSLLLHEQCGLASMPCRVIFSAPANGPTMQFLPTRIQKRRFSITLMINNFKSLGIFVIGLSFLLISSMIRMNPTWAPNSKH